MAAAAHRSGWNRLFVGILLGVLGWGGLSGCRPAHDYVMAELRVEPAGWDSLRLYPSFAESQRFGGAEPVQPDSLVVYALDASYDTLYAGPNLTLTLPDADLGHQERVLIDVCGTIKGFMVCEQTSVLASPKRFHVDPVLVYPLEQDVRRGSYELPILIERQVYGQDDVWEVVRPRRALRGQLRAWVEGRENVAVQADYAREKGQFDLARDERYRDFKFALDSALRTHQAATIRFDVFIDFPGVDGPIASLARAVRVKTQEERQAEVGRLAQRAADRLIEIIDPFVDNRRSVAYVDTWQFNAIRALYTVEMEIRWSGSTFVRNSYRLTGTLEVAEDGQSARFKMIDGDRNGRHRWTSQVSGEWLDLGSLPLPETPVVTAGLYEAVEGLLVVEAEKANAATPADGQAWELRTDRPGFSGAGAMVALPDRKNVVESPEREGSPELVYGVQFDRAGTHYVWLRVWADGGEDNSLHVGLDGSPQRGGMRIETNRYDRWRWTGDTRGRRGPAAIEVDRPGLHTLHIWMREDGFYLDQILLTRDPRFVPDDRPYLESQRSEPAGQEPPPAVVPTFTPPR